MPRIALRLQFALWLVACLPAWAEEPIPDFAFGRIDIVHIGSFLDRVGNYANHLVFNSSYLAKTIVANSLFRVPIDASIQFDGPARIFLIEPFNPGPSQESASILPVQDAAAFRRDLVAVYGKPGEQEGAWTFAVPQPIPEPDHVLVVKLKGARAFIAPSLAIVRQLEALDTPAELGGADAELILSAPAFKRLYGKQAEAALQTGAAVAAENLDALRTVTTQLDEVQKRCWELATVSLRVNVDAGSTTATVELAARAQPGTVLEQWLARPVNGVTGVGAGLLPAETVLAANLNLDGVKLADLVRRYNKNGAADVTAQALSSALLLLDGETTLGLNIEKTFEFFAWNTPRTEQIGAFHRAGLAFLNARAGETKFAAGQEQVEYLGVKIARDKVQAAGSGFAEMAAALVLNNLFQKASGSVNGQFIMGMGRDALKNTKTAIEHAQHPELANAELRTALSAPPPGTLANIWVKPIEFARPLLARILPNEIPVAEILVGLEDPPLTATLALHSGRISLRATLPGTAAASAVQVWHRLRRNGIDPLKLFSGEEEIRK